MLTNNSSMNCHYCPFQYRSHYQNTNIKPKLCMIAAIDQKYGISRNGKIPWNISGDYNFFQDTTTRSETNPQNKNVILMGKNTWFALPRSIRSLKNRINIVLSPDTTQQEIDENNTTKTETYVTRSLNDAFNFCSNRKIEKIFVCGGKYLYDQTLKNCIFDEVYLSNIQHDYNCDNILDKNMIQSTINKFKFHDTKIVPFHDKFTNKSVNISFDKYYNSINYVNKGENKYLGLMKKIIDRGNCNMTRNGKTHSLFGETLKLNLNNGFPLITTKKVYFRGIVEELLFFLRGDTNTKHLEMKNVNIWKQNTSRTFLDSCKLYDYDVGDMGPMYGFQLKHFNEPYFGMNHKYHGGFDQLQYCIDLLKKEPHSRRIIMTTYNPIQANKGVLFPCHGLTIQFNVDSNNKLSCSMTQRSADYICGVPFNIASYALLTHLICNIVNCDPNRKETLSVGKLILNMGDVHIYDEHLDVAKRQLLREPYKFPKIYFKCDNEKFGSGRLGNIKKTLEMIKYDDVILDNYVSYPKLDVRMIA